MPTRRLLWPALGLCAVLLLGACSSKSVRSTTPSPSSTSPPRTVAVTDANDGQTVELHVGNNLRVVLSSTYWRFEPGTDASLLRAEGTPAISSIPGCVPGAGCGTAAATFTAVAPGHATIVATRTSCGEAMLCQGSAGHYQIDVVIS